ncbi:DNA polymerase III subunit [Limnoglobus roseus]|uniref:DNA polymerase III subunit delta n=1 Tax=Limnoglobus roseus TaxID=2598579 RepID=A0A5C1AM72_9BACT|nr:DNA polymerase III subunit delta' [Limnoglobus roseus]QEL19675.1 DNA polymerase III subunit delta' [Limnoglobus roseus]
MAWERIHGHDAIRRQFQAAFARGRLGHAYLFTGPSGVGKRLFALELAKALLCESPLTPLTACDHCSSCALVTAETHPDVHVSRKLEDKNEYTVDVIAEVCKFLQLTPTRGTRKICLLEDGDDINEQSANKFLKNLEEPYPGTTIVILSTSADAQLPTIRSRCQIVPFSPLGAEAITKILAENEITDRAKADRLVRLAGGSAGQALALSDDAVWDFRATLLQALGSPRIASAPLVEKWSEFVESAGKESPAQRARASVVLRLLADLLSQAMRLAHGGGGDGLEPMEAEKLQRFADKVGVDGLVELLEKCVEADYWIDRRVQLPLLAELVVEKISRSVA